MGDFIPTRVATGDASTDADAAPQDLRARAADITCDDGYFVLDRDRPPIRSSGKKVSYGGWWTDGQGRTSDAFCVEYCDPDPSFYGREVGALFRMSQFGIGPRVFGLAGVEGGRLGAGTSAGAIGGVNPVIIEEDVGTSVANAALHVVGGEPSAPIPATDGAGEHLPSEPLHVLGTPERDIENDKIIFDLLSQMYVMHHNQIFHRDAKSNNICLWRYGNDPAAIRATLIDFDISWLAGGGTARLTTKEYFDLLFKELPRRVALRNGKRYRYHVPTDLERDMGFLAIVRYELAKGRRCSPRDVELEDIVWGERPLFSYREDGCPLARMVDQSDIDALGERLGLRKLSRASIPNPVEYRLARRLFEGRGGYLDAKDTAELRASLDKALVPLFDDLAHEAFEAYKRVERSQGRPIAYEGFDEQPPDLQASNYEYAEAIDGMVTSLGYRIVPRAEAAGKDVLREFAPAQIDYLAPIEHARWYRERVEQGWTYGEKRDDVLKTRPNLVPYEKLDPDEVEKNREGIRSIIGMLESHGCVIVR